MAASIQDKAKIRDDLAEGSRVRMCSAVRGISFVEDDVAGTAREAREVILALTSPCAKARREAEDIARLQGP